MSSDRVAAVRSLWPSEVADRLDRVRGEWRMMLPFIFVLASIGLLLLAPMVVARQVSDTRLRMATVDAASRLLLHIQHGFAQASAVVRAHLIAPDSSLPGSFAAIATEQESNLSALDSLVGLLEVDSLRDAVAELRLAAAAQHSRQRRVLSGRIQPHEYLPLRSGGATSPVAVAPTRATISGALRRQMNEAREKIERTQLLGFAAMALLAMLAAISAVIVLRVAQQFRSRAVEERALREAALMLTAAYRVDDVLARIAAAAAEVVGAEASYVERVRDDAEEVQVAATAGGLEARHGVTIPYDRSLTRFAEQRGGVVRVLSVERETPGVLDVVPGCRGCGAVLVLLRTDGDVHGVLVLLHQRPKRMRAETHMRQSRIFAALASLAVRNAIVLRNAELREEELRSVMNSRDRLIRGFSHDVKNPLAAADGHAALLEMGAIMEEHRRLDSMQRIRRGIRTALGLIDDLLELARAESGQLQLHFADVQVLNVLRELVEDFRPAVEQSGHRLETALPTELPVIRTDRHRMRQILGNLMTNAIKHVPSGATIRLSAALRQGRRGRDPHRWITMSVSDNGPGIPEHQQQLLFREFSRLGGTGGSGAGLGLAISANIARRLGGELAVESAIGEGATFTLWLPLHASRSASTQITYC